MRTVIIATALLLAGLSQAQAGSLFPPENIGADTSQKCPAGTLLNWTGNSVACHTVSPNVSVTACPAGQLMAGIQNGVAICRSMTCRLVRATGNAPNYVSYASCNSDEIMTGGGGHANTALPASLGFMHFSGPDTASRWAVDGYSHNRTTDNPTEAVAICCKFK